MPRKTDGPAAEEAVDDRASMRPRPDAAENEGNMNKSSSAFDASMRPRPDAAENALHSVRVTTALTPLQ